MIQKKSCHKNKHFARVTNKYDLYCRYGTVFTFTWTAAWIIIKYTDQIDREKKDYLIGPNLDGPQVFCVHN